jgi:RNA polymerase sigma-70 factor (ECF subfamily)
LLGKREAACRKAFSRAKHHLGDHRPRVRACPDTQKRLLTAFLQAVQDGSMSALLHLLVEEVTFWGDGGGKVTGAPGGPVTGRVAVARFLLESGKVFRSSLPEDARFEVAEVNGQPALLIRAGVRVLLVLTIEVEAGQIRALYAVANPEKLTHVSRAISSGGQMGFSAEELAP